MKAILVLMAVTHGDFTQVPFDTVEQCENQRWVVEQALPDTAAVCVRLERESVYAEHRQEERQRNREALDELLTAYQGEREAEPRSRFLFYLDDLIAREDDPERRSQLERVREQVEAEGEARQ